MLPGNPTHEIPAWLVSSILKPDWFFFTICIGAKYITHNVSFSENELDARRWKRNWKTR